MRSLLVGLTASLLFLSGCVQDAVKEILVQQGAVQNAVVSSMLNKVDWQSIQIALQSRLNNPRITISALYVTGGVVDIVTNGIESEVRIGGLGDGGGVSDPVLSARIDAILRQPGLDKAEKERRIIELIAGVLGVKDQAPASQPSPS